MSIFDQNPHYEVWIPDESFLGGFDIMPFSDDGRAFDYYFKYKEKEARYYFVKDDVEYLLLPV